MDGSVGHCDDPITCTNPLELPSTIGCRYNAVKYNLCITNITAVIESEYKLELEPTKDIP